MKNRKGKYVKYARLIMEFRLLKNLIELTVKIVASVLISISNI